MEKFFTWLRVNRYSIALAVVAIAMMYGFRWGWSVIPSVWWCQVLLIAGTLISEDCVLLLACERFYKFWKRTPELYCNKLAGILWCYLFGFMILAIMTACFAWNNLWLFIGTLALAFLLFLGGLFVVMHEHNRMYGDDW